MSGPERDDVFEAHEIRVWRFVLNELLTNGFVVQERDGDALAVIDPGDRADDLIEAAEAWGGDVRWILVTHLHGDHCARVGDLAAAFPAAEVAGPPGGPFRPHRPVSGGETLFFDSKQDAAFVVSPRPGRLCIFDGTLLHCGRPPSRICFSPRYTFAYKLERY